MPTIDYPYSAPYLSAPGGALAPLLEVELIRGAQTARVLGVVDSGATVTVFNPEHANLLGIDNVEEGEAQSVSTQAGSVDYYLFELEMQVQLNGHSNRFPCRVGFFATKKPRNILGRNYIFGHYKIGFWDSQGMMYFLPIVE
jgi:Aspartyl protease